MNEPSRIAKIPDALFHALPTVEVEETVDDPRRKSKRRRVPAVLQMLDDEDRVRIVRLQVTRASANEGTGHCARLADCSREGAHIVTDQEFSIGSEIRVTGVCAETGIALFHNGFRVRRRRVSMSGGNGSGAAAKFTFGSIVDQSLDEDARRLDHYGLEFLETGVPGTQTRNMVLQAFRDSALLRHARRRKRA